MQASPVPLVAYMAKFITLSIGWFEAVMRPFLFVLEIGLLDVVQFERGRLGQAVALPRHRRQDASARAGGPSDVHR